MAGESDVKEEEAYKVQCWKCREYVLHYEQVDVTDNDKAVFLCRKCEEGGIYTE